MIALPMRAARAIAVAGIAAGFLTATFVVPSAAAEKTPTPAESMHEQMAQRLTMHLQAQLDELAARLQIKASQEPAWQAFSGAYRDLVTAHLAQREAARAGTADLDAASLARKRADWAAEDAQRLAKLADATGKLQQSLSPDQRLVLNEVARHFAQEHFAHGHRYAHGDESHGRHCEGHDAHGGWEHHSGPHGGPMGEGDQAPGENMAR